MTTEELTKSIDDLNQVTLGIKTEVLDIKEVLADYDYMIKDISNTIDIKQNDTYQFINQELSKYMSSDYITNEYYTKNEIDGKFDRLDYIHISDVENYLINNKYITQNNIKDFITLNKLNDYFDLYLKDYPTLTKCNELFVTKNELDKAIDKSYIDTSEFVNYNYLTNNYYTKSDVEKMLPSTSGFVKKSELYSLLPLEDFAFTDWVENNFLRKNSISFDDYVNKNMLNDELSKFDNVVDTTSLKLILSDYVKETEFNTALSNLSKIIKDEYVPFALSNFKDENNFLTKNDIRGYVTKAELSNLIIGNENDTIDISEFAKLSDLDKYIPSNVLDKTLFNLLNSINDDYIPNAIREFKNTCGYITEKDTYRIFATKDDVRYIINNTPNTDISTDYVKHDELKNYIKEDSLNKALQHVISTIDEDYIPNALVNFKEHNNFVSQTYVNANFATKDDLVKYITNNSDNVDLDNYVIKDDLINYVNKKDLANYVDYNSYIENIFSINNNINLIKKSLNKYSTLSQLSEYIREDTLMTCLNDYVNKDMLFDELSKLSKNDNVNCNIDTSNFLTHKDYEKIKTYVETTLDNYVLKNETYTKSTLDNYFVKESDLSDIYYNKIEIDNNFIRKNDADNTFLNTIDAYSIFLSKEDYRGIKNAMTLNNSFKNANEIFEALKEKNKLLDGFYLVGNKIIIIKDNKSYTSDFISSDFEAYSKNEMDEKFITKEEFDKTKCQWIIDKGGNY